MTIEVIVLFFIHQYCLNDISGPPQLEVALVLIIYIVGLS